MIAVNSSALRIAPQSLPPAPEPVGDNAGFEPTIVRYQAAKARQRFHESEGRKAKNEADALETALADATEAAGGTMQAGKFVLGFELKNGQPSYKSIAEYIVAQHKLPPETILNEVEKTEKRRVLVIA